MTFLKGEHGKIQKCKHVSKRSTLCCLFFQVVFGECFLLVSMGFLCSFNLLCVLWDDSGRFLLVNIFQLLLIFIINDVPVNTLLYVPVNVHDFFKSRYQVVELLDKFCAFLILIDPTNGASKWLTTFPSNTLWLVMYENTAFFSFIRLNFG